MGGSPERHTTSKGLSCRRCKYSRAIGLGSRYSREKYVIAGHGARVRDRPRRRRTMALRQPKKERLDLPHSQWRGGSQGAEKTKGAAGAFQLSKPKHRDHHQNKTVKRKSTRA